MTGKASRLPQVCAGIVTAELGTSSRHLAQTTAALTISLAAAVMRLLEASRLRVA